MFEIYFRPRGSGLPVVKVEIQGIKYAQIVWDRLNKTFEMRSTRP